MGLIKLAAVVFGAYTLGGNLGVMVYDKLAPNTNQFPGSPGDYRTGAMWAGRAVAFVGFSYIASKV